MTGLPVFVISLPHSVPRRAPLIAALTRLGIAHEVVEATDGEQLVRRGEVPWSDAATLETQPLLGRRLTGGEIGCAVSHLALWHRIAAAGTPALVLEDDCRLAPAAPAIVARLAALRRDWDLVLLGHRSARRGPEAGATPALGGRALGGGHRLARLVEFAMGSDAYALSPRGAKRLARFAEPIRMPADWVTGYAPAAGVRLHGITPPCAVSDVSLPSTIPARDSAREPAAVVARPVRALAGRAWLTARRLGLWPGGYIWPYAAALQPRRGRTTTA